MKTRRLFKVLASSLPIVSIGSFGVVSCSSHSFKLEVETPEGINLEFTNLEFVVGRNFWTYITSDKEINDVTVTVGEEVLPEEAIFFAPSNEQFKYYLKIYGDYITSNKVIVKITNKPVVEDITITFDAGEGTIDGQHFITKTFNSRLTWADIEKPDNPIYPPYSFKHWSLQPRGSIVDDAHTFEDGDRVFAVYDHEEDYGLKYDDQNNKFYKQCKICGDWKYLTDEELEQNKNKFFTKNADGYLEDKGSNLSNILDSHPAGQHIDVYVTDGLFKLGIRSDGAISSVTIHGHEDDDGNRRATIDCRGNYIGTGGPTQYDSLKLKCEHLTMQGDVESINQFHGIRTYTYECNYCTFTNTTTLWCVDPSYETKFNNCIFDSTSFDNEYPVYMWFSPSITTFNDCVFITHSKGIKFYSLNFSYSRVFNLNNCEFEVVEPYWTEKQYYVCEIATDGAIIPESASWTINISNCQKHERFLNWADPDIQSKCGNVIVNINKN